MSDSDGEREPFHYEDEGDGSGYIGGAAAAAGGILTGRFLQPET